MLRLNVNTAGRQISHWKCFQLYNLPSPCCHLRLYNLLAPCRHSHSWNRFHSFLSSDKLTLQARPWQGIQNEVGTYSSWIWLHMYQTFWQGFGAHYWLGLAQTSKSSSVCHFIFFNYIGWFYILPWLPFTKMTRLQTSPLKFLSEELQTKGKCLAIKAQKRSSDQISS